MPNLTSCLQPLLFEIQENLFKLTQESWENSDEYGELEEEYEDNAKSIRQLEQEIAELEDRQSEIKKKMSRLDESQEDYENSEDHELKEILEYIKIYAFEAGWRDACILKLERVIQILKDSDRYRYVGELEELLKKYRNVLQNKLPNLYRRRSRLSRGRGHSQSYRSPGSTGGSSTNTGGNRTIRH